MNKIEDRNLSAVKKKKKKKKTFRAPILRDDRDITGLELPTDDRRL